MTDLAWVICCALIGAALVVSCGLITERERCALLSYDPAHCERYAPTVTSEPTP